MLLRDAPHNLNPAFALDATSQQITALIFGSLDTLTTQKLSAKNARRWTLPLKSGLTDHAGDAITPARVLECVENYRKYKGGPSTLLPLYANLEVIQLSSKNSLIFHFRQPEPFFDKHLIHFKYFRAVGHEEACPSVAGATPLIGSGDYRPHQWNAAPERTFLLEPLADGPALDLVFIQDGNTKLLSTLRGDIDVSYNALPFTKAEWIKNKHSDRFELIEAPGNRVSFLDFNLRHPILKIREVRLAIAQAINREEIIRARIPGTLAHSIIPPALPEHFATPLKFDPIKSEQLLDRAGFKKHPATGVRFELTFTTTPSRESQELGMILQKMLKPIGIHLKIETVETAVFFASLRKGNFELYSSRWLGITDGSILYRTLHSSQPANRSGFKNPKIDQLLDEAIHEPDPRKRNALFHQIQAETFEDLPVLPLWYWNNSLVLKKGLQGVTSADLPPNGGLEPLKLLRLP